MNKAKKGCYKYCIVPNCISTTIKTPNKIFFQVPLRTDRRMKWCKTMKRDLISPKSIKYVCEDHFDVENDAENLIKFKLVGGTLKLKSEVYPHKFDCQTDHKLVPRREDYEGRRPKGLNEKLFKEDADSSSYSGFQPVEVKSEPITCDYDELSEATHPLPDDLTDHIEKSRKKVKHKGAQVNMKVSQKDKQIGINNTSTVEWGYFAP